MNTYINNFYAVNKLEEFDLYPMELRENLGDLNKILEIYLFVFFFVIL